VRADLREARAASHVSASKKCLTELGLNIHNGIWPAPLKFHEERMHRAE
jgi:hypothetical protein